MEADEGMDVETLRIDIDRLAERLETAERTLAQLVLQVETIHDRLGTSGEVAPS